MNCDRGSHLLPFLLELPSISWVCGCSARALGLSPSFPTVRSRLYQVNGMSRNDATSGVTLRSTEMCTPFLPFCWARTQR